MKRPLEPSTYGSTLTERAVVSWDLALWARAVKGEPVLRKSDDRDGTRRDERREDVSSSVWLWILARPRKGLPKRATRNVRVGLRLVTYLQIPHTSSSGSSGACFGSSPLAARSHRQMATACQFLILQRETDAWTSQLVARYTNEMSDCILT